MKYVIIWTTIVVLFIPAFMLGILNFLWTFKKEKFSEGCRILGTKPMYNKVMNNLYNEVKN